MSPKNDDSVDPNELFTQFGDLFGDLFGATPGGPVPRDLQLPVQLSLEEAVDGGSQEVEVARFFSCSACDGRGAAKDAPVQPCGDCDGEGKESKTEGFFSFTKVCASCNGRGQLFETPCDECSGARGETKRETLTVAIPPGVATGQRLRLRGKGNELRDGQGPGDLYIAIDVGPHEHLSRDGDDLLVTVVVDPSTARDGGMVSAPFPGGAVDVRVPAGLDDVREVRLEGYGAVKLGSPKSPRPTGDEVPCRSVGPSPHRGDLVVQLVIEGHEVSRDAHLRTLGLTRAASGDDVKRAYRQLALELHPDRSPGAAAAARFASVSEAYAVLTGRDPEPTPESSSESSLWPIWLALGLVAGVAVVVAMAS